MPAESGSGAGAFAGATITVTVAVGSSCARLVNASAFCRLSTACSIFRSPRSLVSHLNLGVTISLQHRLGQIAEKMVVAVAMRHARKLRRDPRHERVLLVRDPEANRLVQGCGPLLGLGD